MVIPDDCIIESFHREFPHINVARQLLRNLQPSRASHVGRWQPVWKSKCILHEWPRLLDFLCPPHCSISHHHAEYSPGRLHGTVGLDGKTFDWVLGLILTNRLNVCRHTKRTHFSYCTYIISMKSVNCFFNTKEQNEAVPSQWKYWTF